MKIALFVDFDNVYSGLRRISAEAAERFSRQPLRWLQWLTKGIADNQLHDVATDRRRVLVRRCYLNPVMYQRYRRPFHEAGFEIVDCPPMTATGKTSTDIHLVLDTMDALMDETHFDEFVVFSADADFTPVLRRLRRHDRRTVVFAAGAMSESYKASADRVIDIPTFLRDALELASVEDDDELPLPGEHTLASSTGSVLRQHAIELIHTRVLQAHQPVPLPALAQILQRDIAGLRESHWDGAGSFGSLLRQLDVPDVQFDFQGDVAMHRQRMTQTDSPGGSAPAARGIDAGLAPSTEALLSPTELRAAAEAIVRRTLAESATPVHLATLGQVLRRALPPLLQGWAGAPTFAAFLQQLHIEPLQRGLLENGTTAVLYDPARHEVPAGLVGDRLVAGMLRAAELPEMKGIELVRILAAARPSMGGSEPFEIAEVSRHVAADMLSSGERMSARRAAAVLQALIFGGLDASRAYPATEDLVVASMGVVLSAWSRETQTEPDEDARNRLIAWLGTAAEFHAAA